jgi:hypothetical protein
LNLFSVRNPLTSPVSVSSGNKLIDRTIEFDSGYDGAWQTLPDQLLDELREAKFDIIFKAGMSLLRVPPRDKLPTPILSYHHGDPDSYRGRPAGFWELHHKVPVVGQIVQIISSKLDAGEVVAYGETKTFPHSYRATLIEAYRHSPLLINHAIANALTGTFIEKTSAGPNYRLPSNWIVIRFLLRMAVSYVLRLLYGAFVEKMWRVSLAAAGDRDRVAIATGAAFPDAREWRTLPVKEGYLFYADPFFSTDKPGILVEALSRRTGRGEILLVSGDEHRRVSSGPGHLSYPSTLRTAGKQFVIPEAASWSGLKMYLLTADGMTPARDLLVQGGVHVVDPTLLEHNGRYFLFGNDRAHGSNTLHLWSAEELESEFKLHPLSPIRISPKGARMAGALVQMGPRLLRLGQSFVSGYGDGIFAFEIKALSHELYHEQLVGEIRFKDRKGPHTLNFAQEEIVFDWYCNRVAPLAAVRRLSARLRTRKARVPEQ